ncbi:MAG: hypothetical protein WKF91_01410 [Segetibacter sp.]
MKKFTLLFAVLIIKFTTVYSQVIDSMMKVYAEDLPEQKVHVHFDKDIYRAGETIWFKSYLLSGFQLTNNSKNFYAELIDRQGNVVQRKVYPVTESSAAGYFDIPENFPANDLIFRGYTTWMLNFDTAFVYEKQLNIVDKNGVAAKSTTAANQPAAASLQFFPESGNLVSQLESEVAFKANDNYGLPVVAKGNIVNSKGKVVTPFASKHDGMGTFNLTPEAGETYNAVWTDPSGTQQTTALPAAKNQGLIMHMPGAGKKKVYVLNRTNEVPEAWKTVYIVAQLGQQKVYRAKVSLQNVAFTSGAISTDNFPSGILTVTVFSETWEPIVERIVMINNNNYTFEAKVNAPEINTNIRARNTLEVEVGDTLLSNLSIAVTDASLGRQKNEDNIISRLLLTGDIKGYVHNPTYYFSNNSDSIAAHLDLVLLTHGWRRYNWSDLAAGKKPVLKFPNDPALSLNAKIFGISSASPLRQDEEIFAIVKGTDSSSHFLSIPKTGKDQFSINNAIFFDTIKLYYDFTKDRKLKDRASVFFDNNFYKGPRKINLLSRPWYFQNTDTGILNRTRFLADQLTKFGSKFDPKGNVLENVTVKTRVKSLLEKLDEKYASGMFRNTDGYNFDFASDANSYGQDIFSFLQGRVPGLQISRGGGSASVSWRGSQTSLFIDEMQADPERLSSLSVNDIAYVKVIRPPFMGAIGGGAGGAIAVYTRRGGDVQMPAGKGLNSTVVVGYSSNKQFYSPDYASRNSSSDVVADYRSTLFWNPAVLTGPGRQKVRLEFYNNDISKSFRVILEGVNEIGKIVRIEKVIAALSQ